LLLLNGVFPLARDELPEELDQIGHSELGGYLHRSIHERPEVNELRSAITYGQEITSGEEAGRPDLHRAWATM
jgi:hypothetical protein